MIIKIETPSVPNFLRTKFADKEEAVSLAYFNDEQLELVAKDWKEKLFRNRDRLKANKDLSLWDRVDKEP